MDRTRVEPATNVADLRNTSCHGKTRASHDAYQESMSLALLDPYHRNMDLTTVVVPCTVPKLAYTGADQLVRRVGQAAR